MNPLLPIDPGALARAVAFATALAAALTLPDVARRIGWVDGAAASDRKLQRRAVPAVGGAVVLVGLCAGWSVLAAAGRGLELPLPGRGLGRMLAAALGGGATLWPLGGALTAFAVGLVDDLVPGGLTPRVKLAGQALSGVVLGAPLIGSASVEPAALTAALLALALGAAVAINALNTFDNADGAAGSLAWLGCALAAPLVGAALLPFLALNLTRSRGPSTGSGAVAVAEPRAYLGDSGSHLLGMLILITPAAWPILTLPLWDLARLAWVRSKAGSAPWVGDRRHLAHRLARAGLPRLAVPLTLSALALPTALWGWSGAVLTVLLASAALGWAGPDSKVPGARDGAPPVPPPIPAGVPQGIPVSARPKTAD